MKKNSIVYNLAPQLKTYHALGEIWKPFIMYSTRPNFRSKVVNSDQFGLRFNDLDHRDSLEMDKNNSIFNKKIFPEKKETAVFVGSSSAFGIGASSDATTIPSLLSKKTNMHFFNLGCPAFSGFQEIILFQSLANYLSKINKIVIFSGINDIFLTNYISTYDPILGPFFYSNAFNEGMTNATLNWKRSLAKFFLNPFTKDNIHWNLIKKKELYDYFIKKKPYKSAQLTDREEILKNLIKRNFIFWSNIQKAMGVKLIYVLQPKPNWCNKDLSEEETKIFKELDSVSNKTVQTLRLLDFAKYNSYRTYLAEICNKLDIEFIDSNEYISNKNFHKEWLFVDRLHMTDLGYRYISEMILSRL